MSDEIVNRLRCRYASGPIINGEPEFGWRDFGGPVEKLMLPTPIMKEAADEIERLRAEVAGLREDAERYRWLRDPHNQDCHSVGKCTPDTESYEAIDWLYGDELDVSIDAALAARKGTT